MLGRVYSAWPDLLGDLKKFAQGAGAAPSAVAPAPAPASLAAKAPQDEGLGTEKIELIAASGTSAGPAK